MGALLAHEIACQLERSGEQVESLVLLDPPFAMPAERSTDAELAEQFVTDVLRTLGRPDGQGVPVTNSATASATGSVAGALDRLAALFDVGGGDRAAARAELERRFAGYATHRRLMSDYRPHARVQAPALLISACQSPNAAAVALWAELLGAGSVTVPVEADHYSLLLPPASQQVAKEIAANLVR
jgi:thioesterase domain-containing protein